MDAKAAAVAYTDRIIADAVARGRSPASVAAMREELDSPCTEEMAAFDQFIELASRDSFDVTVFDTAPTGHTMRLLELPIDWSRQIDVKVFASVDTAAADDVAKARFGGVIEMMRDPAQSTFAFVMYPESTPIVEASRAIAELKTLGIPLGLVVANMVLPEEACADAVRAGAPADAAGVPRRHRSALRGPGPRDPAPRRRGRRPRTAGRAARADPRSHLSRRLTGGSTTMLDLSTQDPAGLAAAPRAAEAEALAAAGTFGAALRASPEFAALLAANEALSARTPRRPPPSRPSGLARRSFEPRR